MSLTDNRIWLSPLLYCSDVPSEVPRYVYSKYVKLYATFTSVFKLGSIRPHNRGICNEESV